MVERASPASARDLQGPSSKQISPVTIGLLVTILLLLVAGGRQSRG
jgi:hypothetical protein